MSANDVANDVRLWCWCVQGQATSFTENYRGCWKFVWHSKDKWYLCSQRLLRLYFSSHVSFKVYSSQCRGRSNYVNNGDEAISTEKDRILRQIWHKQLPWIIRIQLSPAFGVCRTCNNMMWFPGFATCLRAQSKALWLPSRQSTATIICRPVSSQGSAFTSPSSGTMSRCPNAVEWPELRSWPLMCNQGELDLL